ncbi:MULTISPECIES: hypothetical protein [unclassified Crossiella]|uniref:hypothetical protein n=1 Tax=unclassified Crossiella TaxID=2620835 RepID=UPI00200046DA|nr:MULTISPECIES: hypothetical protein [unclassified Crossiella]MCK2243831.1 hypothetical protein [Crossiella sp. S99.2]MCK2257690.1 hypothetical protein [Crossiella sp. S99.1]
MSDNVILGSMTQPEPGDRLAGLYAAKPVLRILAYTDQADTVQLNNVAGFGVGILRDLLEKNAPFHTDIRFDLVQRHGKGYASDRLTPELLAGYDQIWFFGIMPCDLPAQGMPTNELTDPEVAALRAWMDAGGGVLICGDHSNPKPPGADPALNELLNLGRAIAHRVPRAGEMRVWEGLPDSSIQFSHNTHQPDGRGSDINNPIPMDADGFPQELILKRYPPFHRPHPVFSGKNGPITVFPDHMHEGQLRIPDSYPAQTWPSGPFGQPKPEIVARGTDKRNGSVYGVLATYDGHAAGVGRIVADSTWHHYFNINLFGFVSEPTVAARMAEYYVNLTLWLAPARKRQQAQARMLWWLSNHPVVRMAFGNPAADVGRTALGLLATVTNPATAADLAWPLPAPTTLPEDLTLGAQLVSYWQELNASTDTARGAAELVDEGLRAAAEEHAAALRRSLAETENLGTSIESGLRLAHR